jgi:lycopene beta-cyclase
LQHLVKKSWQSLRFTGRGFSKTATIAPYQYHFIPGDDFFHYFNQDFLPQQQNIALIDAPVHALVPHEKGFTLHGPERQWQAAQVYSSIFAQPATLGRFWLKQHFKGWFVRTDRAVFDDSCVTLMDFSIEQTEDTRFIYILPFSAQYALIEITVFSPEIYADNAYDQVLEAYFRTHFPDANYTIEKTEFGAIPMTDTLFPRRGAAGEVLLGAAAGMVKASTGYAFRRIGEDVRQLAEDLQTGNKLRWAGTKGRFRFYDRLLLGILQQEPLLGQRIFEALFKRIDMKTILRFLDEDTHWTEELRIFSRLPFSPFFKQMVQQWRY